MPHPHTPGSQATETPPDGDAPVITNDLYTPITLEEDPPGAPASEDHPAPKAGDLEDGEPTPPPAKPAGSEDPTAEKDKDKNLRFKTIEEYDHGYRHVQSHASRLEQENKDLREREKKRREEVAAAEERAAREVQFRKYAAERRTQLMKDIGELDPDADNHAEELGRLYAESDADIWSFQQSPPPIEKPAGGDTPTKEGDTPPNAPESELPPETPTLEEQETAYQTVITAVEAAGVPLKDPTFQGFSAKAPATDAAGNPIPLDQQAQWAITQTRDSWLKHLAGEAKLDPEDPALQHFVAKAPATDAEGKPLPLADRLRTAILNTQTYHATQRSQAVQEAGAPLTSGARFGIPPGGKPPGAARHEAPAPATLDQALSLVREQRTL